MCRVHKIRSGCVADKTEKIKRDLLNQQRKSKDDRSSKNIVSKNLFLNAKLEPHQYLPPGEAKGAPAPVRKMDFFDSLKNSVTQRVTLFWEIYASAFLAVFFAGAFLGLGASFFSRSTMAVRAGMYSSTYRLPSNSLTG